MRGVVIERQLASPNALTLIRSLVNRSSQLYCLSSGPGKPLREDENRQERYEREAKEEEEAIKERISKYPWACPYPGSVCTKEQKEELARIAETVPKSTTPLVRACTEYVLLHLQRTDGRNFEEKIRIMHETIEDVSRGCISEEEENRQIQQDSEKEAKEEEERKYHGACPYPDDSVCTRGQKRLLARIAKTIPESAPGLVKQYVEYVLLNLQHTDRWEFEENLRMLHETIEEVSRGCISEKENRKIQEDSESDDDEDSMKEWISKYPLVCPYPGSVCTKEQKK